VNDKTIGVLELIDAAYPPTEKAVEHREHLIAASNAPDDELPYYVAQLSVMLTHFDRVAECGRGAKNAEEWLGKLLEESVAANLAFSIAIGLMRASIGILDESEAVN
jgi:hypothetical protein